jgi:murein L,D-transpeptidase YafK
MRYILSFVFLALLIAAPVSASAPSQAMRELQPKAKPTVAHITVLKSMRRMYLLDPDGNIVREYPIALGGNPVGDKEQEGDGKTPEGRYKISYKNQNSEFYKSLKIDYPNKNDIWRAKRRGVKPGSNIFIHGQPNGKSWMFWKYNTEKDWTWGCVAVSNTHIDEIWDLVDEGTTVLIKP